MTEAKGKGDDFYAGELEGSLRQGAGRVRSVRHPGQPGDQEDDPTSEWPERPQERENGTHLDHRGQSRTATCDAGIFDPNNLADGVEPSKNDKILPMRSLDYAVSFGRRQTN